MLCLGPKKSLSLPTLELKAQGIAQCTKDQSQLRIHSAIQAPPRNSPPRHLRNTEILHSNCIKTSHMAY